MDSNNYTPYNERITNFLDELHKLTETINAQLKNSKSGREDDNTSRSRRNCDVPHPGSSQSQSQAPETVTKPIPVLVSRNFSPECQNSGSDDVRLIHQDSIPRPRDLSSDYRYPVFRPRNTLSAQRFQRPYVPTPRYQDYDHPDYNQFQSCNQYQNYNQYRNCNQYPNYPDVPDEYSNRRRYQPYSVPPAVRPRAVAVNGVSHFKKFKELPFLNLISELLPPQILHSLSQGCDQENVIRLKLNQNEYDTFVNSRYLRDNKLEYKNRILMRFCLDKNTNQLEDKFPLGLRIKVNKHHVPLDVTFEDWVSMKSRPIDISTFVQQKSKKYTNKIIINWLDDKRKNNRYAVAIYLVHKTTSDDLFDQLKTMGPRNSDYTRRLIVEKLNEDAEGEIATTDLRVSLVCPIGKIRMSTPCRTSGCTHFQCFDGLLFLKMNELKAKWNCPICNKPTSYDDLVIDDYFNEILSSSKLKPDVNEVQLFKDGSWDNFVPHEESNKQMANKLKSRLDVEVIDVDCVPSTSDCDTQVIDLVSSDEDNFDCYGTFIKKEPGVLKEEIKSYILDRESGCYITTNSATSRDDHYF
ncbi:E3 SUMO-protein ligase PIAS4-A-like [Microplitis mediator]|uniref:E3 SUMO-protein ligase PIAS4-A-like n=1 Tax=Microplitis mediator TaxID=375433 RepID=UPI002556D18E|nr:E3 SUMO-protein ligase PIAS4-A-like [Microplitis mediator]